jgi:predicted RNase H-like HicB family nuclease
VEQDDGWWYGRSVELPGVMGDGRTPQAAVAATRAAVITALATMFEEGDVPPTPARLGARTEQVNIRLSAEERLRIEALARQGGFKGMGDYMRAMALCPSSG